MILFIHAAFETSFAKSGQPYWLWVLSLSVPIRVLGNVIKEWGWDGVESIGIGAGNNGVERERWV